MVTGGAGFIGSAVCRYLVRQGHAVVNVDKLTYAGHLSSLKEISNSPSYAFIQADICDQPRMLDVMSRYEVDAVMNLAAETHVDRSIDGPAPFVETNVVGTFRLLDAALDYFRRLSPAARSRFRFHHISTDEVFGSLPFDGASFSEGSCYRPSSPYSASKAASDHFVMAWHTTYGLPVVLSNCSNNYGPYQYPEKLIPLTILSALAGEPIRVYGRGINVRDWLYVDDHAAALERVLTAGRVGESYAIGGRAERTNIAVVEAICTLLDARGPCAPARTHRDLITFVEDRPGHDLRYAIDPAKAERELGWNACESFESALARTVDWYLGAEWWWRPIRERRASSGLRPAVEPDPEV